MHKNSEDCFPLSSPMVIMTTFQHSIHNAHVIHSSIHFVGEFVESITIIFVYSSIPVKIEHIHVRPLPFCFLEQINTG